MCQPCNYIRRPTHLRTTVACVCCLPFSLTPLMRIKINWLPDIIVNILGYLFNQKRSLLSYGSLVCILYRALHYNCRSYWEYIGRSPLILCCRLFGSNSLFSYHSSFYSFFPLCSRYRISILAFTRWGDGVKASKSVGIYNIFPLHYIFNLGHKKKFGYNLHRYIFCDVLSISNLLWIRKKVDFFVPQLSKSEYIMHNTFTVIKRKSLLSLASNMDVKITATDNVYIKT